MPTKAEQKVIDATIAGFNAQYASTDNWGPERWESSLLPALSRPTRHAALVNHFARTDTFHSLIENAGLGPLDLLQLPRDPTTLDAPLVPPLSVYIKPVDEQHANGKSHEPQFPQPAPTSTGAHIGSRRLLSHWNLDAASVLCAHMLAVQPMDKVLDLCAAPGGKSLLLAHKLYPHLYASPSAQTPPTTTSKAQGQLHVNELDKTRNRRLASNLESYLPLPLFRTKHVQVLNHDASDPRSAARFPCGSGAYDRVLLDAPCSSERHLIHSHLRAQACGRVAQDSELTRWRRGHSRNLAKTQAALLMTALRAVRVGGRVVYSTCSIERGENDGVIDKVREVVAKERKKGSVDWDFECLLGRAVGGSARGAGVTDDNGDQAQIEALDAWSEKTLHGRIVLPDHPSNGQWGPLFFCIITKVAMST